ILLHCPLYCIPAFLSLSFPTFSFSSPPPTELSTLSLHDALPIYGRLWSYDPASDAQEFVDLGPDCKNPGYVATRGETVYLACARSEEHTSELQSRENLVCRLLLEKKKIA